MSNPGSTSAPSHAPAVEVFLPGRLCLLGEHSDWAASYRRDDPSLATGAAIVVPTDQGIVARAERVSSPEFVFGPVPGHAEELAVPLNRGDLVHALRHPFFGPLVGTLLELLERHRIGGTRLAVSRSDLPIGRGLASSAAACVMLVRAVASLHDLEGIDSHEEMRLAAAGERRAGSLCGRMDQVCALGPGCRQMEFDGDDVTIRGLKPGGVFHVVLVALGPRKDTPGILRDLNRCYPRAPGVVASRCRDALGRQNLALVAWGAKAVRDGDAVALGRCLTEAQELFDDAVAPVSPALAEPRVRGLLREPLIRDCSLGGKGVGSHGDALAQILARDAECQRELLRRIPDELGLFALALTF